MSSRIFGAGAGILADRSFQLLLLAGFVGVTGIGIVSPILERLIGPLGTSPAEIGLMVTAISAPGIVLIPISGILADRFGRKPVLVVGLLLFGGAGAAIAATVDFRIVLGLRVLQGIGFAGINPIIVTSIGDLYTDEEEAAGQGFRMVVTGVSFVLFPIVAGILVGTAWQLPFLLYGLALPIAVILVIWFEEPMGSREAARAAVGGQPDHQSYLSQVLTLATQPAIAMILLARPFSVAAPIGLMTYNSLVVVQVLAGDPAAAGLVIATIAGVQGAVSTQVGRINAAIDDPRRALLAANGCFAVGSLIFGLAPALWVAVTGAMVAGLGGGFAFPLYRSFVTGVAPERLRGGLVSIAEAMSRTAVTFTPIVMGASIAYLASSAGATTAIRITVAGAGALSAALSFLCVLGSWLAD